MSIDFNVFVVRAPKNLRACWQDALAALGLVCELRPDFDPATWGGSDLVAKMLVTPGAFDGAERYGSVPFITGCGMDLWHAPEFDDERDALVDRCPKPLRAKLAKATRKFSFTTSMGRPPDAYRFQVFAAATLAQITGGLFHADPAFHTGEAALEQAAVWASEMEDEKAIRLKAGRGWTLRPFQTWRAALKDAIPEYTEASPDAAADRGRL